MNAPRKPDCGDLRRESPAYAEVCKPIRYMNEPYVTAVAKLLREHAKRPGLVRSAPPPDPRLRVIWPDDPGAA